MSEKYVLCEDKNRKNYYTVRPSTDCSPEKFKTIKTFDTYENACKNIKSFVKNMR